MGGRGSKMCEFEQFETSLKVLWPTILKLDNLIIGLLKSDMPIEKD
jgi:hypothetical protein